MTCRFNLNQLEIVKGRRLPFSISNSVLNAKNKGTTTTTIDIYNYFYFLYMYNKVNIFNTKSDNQVVRVIKLTSNQHINDTHCNNL